MSNTTLVKRYRTRAVGDEVQYIDGNQAVIIEVHRDDGVPWYYTIRFQNDKPERQTVARKLARWIPKIN